MLFNVIHTSAHCHGGCLVLTHIRSAQSTAPI